MFNKSILILSILFSFNVASFAETHNTTQNKSLKENKRGLPEVARSKEFKNNLNKPYYLVIFDIDLNENKQDYFNLGKVMLERAKTMPGYIDATSVVSGDREIVLCSWESLEAIQAWYEDSEHIKAQKLGETKYFDKLRLRIAKVERDYTHLINKNK